VEGTTCDAGSAKLSKNSDLLPAQPGALPSRLMPHTFCSEFRKSLTNMPDKYNFTVCWERRRLAGKRRPEAAF